MEPSAEKSVKVVGKVLDAVKEVASGVLDIVTIRKERHTKDISGALK